MPHSQRMDSSRITVNGPSFSRETFISAPNIPCCTTAVSYTHLLFVGYAPASEPKYAIAVRIANGYSSGNACLAANDIFKYIFKLADEETILTGIASSDTSNTSND